YGQLNPATLEAIELAAQTEALILDPVYTGKTMAGFIQRARQAGPGQSLLFIHTGGTPALFAYGEALEAAMANG
ncbi:MAG: D-cysteine desulfhydrase, partial [Gammaproteobacteria bacterium]|nr:D-cysteine desulfhydrase [Gammaproteobacteria bacterium]